MGAMPFKVPVQGPCVDVCTLYVCVCVCVGVCVDVCACRCVCACCPYDRLQIVSVVMCCRLLKSANAAWSPRVMRPSSECNFRCDIYESSDYGCVSPATV